MGKSCGLNKARTSLQGARAPSPRADSPHKQELDPAILTRADLVVCDSISQCLERGDTAAAVNRKLISIERIAELGNVISGRAEGRVSEDQITVADLTGVAVQDIQIATALYNRVITAQ